MHIVIFYRILLETRDRTNVVNLKSIYLVNRSNFHQILNVYIDCFWCENAIDLSVFQGFTLKDVKTR